MAVTDDKKQQQSVHTIVNIYHTYSESIAITMEALYCSIYSIKLGTVADEAIAYKMYINQPYITDKLWTYFLSRSLFWDYFADTVWKDNQ